VARFVAADPGSVQPGGDGDRDHHCSHRLLAIFVRCGSSLARTKFEL